MLKDFDGYKRRLDAFDYLAKHRDMPRDITSLLRAADAIDLEERIILCIADKGD